MTQRISPTWMRQTGKASAACSLHACKRGFASTSRSQEVPNMEAMLHRDSPGATLYLTKVLQLITVGKALETYDVDVEVGHCLSGGSAVLHRELQAFRVEATADSHAHALCKQPHVGDLGRQ